MARALSTAFKNALSETVIRPRFLFALEGSAATFRFWTGTYALTWNAQVWSFTGWLEGIGQVEQTSRTTTNDLSIALTAESSAVVATLMTLVTQNKKGTIYFAPVDDSEVIISDPEVYFEGALSAVRFIDDIDSSRVELTYTNELYDSLDENVNRYTHESQQSRFAGDLGFIYVSQLADFNGFWGKPDAKREKKTRRERRRARRTTRRR